MHTPQQDPPDIDGTGADDPGEESLFHPPNAERALCWIAALASAGIPYRLTQEDGTWRLHVVPSEAQAAKAEIDRYEEDNRNWPPAEPEPRTPWPSDLALIPSLTVALLLLLTYAYTGPYDADIPLFRRGAAASEKILDGEWWRIVTALTLHGDRGHVLANAASLAILGTIAGTRFGPGLAWALILGTGVLGNAAATWMGPPGKISVGASTMVFGAIGLFTGAQLLRKLQTHGLAPGAWRRSWLVLVAGAGLLGFLGTSARADLFSHFYGFLFGLGLGLPAAFAVRRARPGLTVQAALFACSGLAVYASWLWGIR